MKCPFCAEEIMNDAKKCRFCGEWINKNDNTPNNFSLNIKKIVFIGSIVGVFFWNFIFILSGMNTTANIFGKTLIYGIIQGITTSLIITKTGANNSIFSSVFLGSISCGIASGILLNLMSEEKNGAFTFGFIFGFFLGTIIGVILYITRKSLKR